MPHSIAIHWFRQDLRLADNPALFAAAKRHKVLPLYILDDITPGKHRMGAASRWWLHHSLASLNHSLGGRLNLYRGDPRQVLAEIAERYAIETVYWNRCYEPWRVAHDATITDVLRARGIEVRNFNGSLLREPQENLKKDGTPYHVFTWFYRKCYSRPWSPRKPLPKPETLETYVDATERLPLARLDLIPTVRWHQKLEAHWSVGEEAALEKVRAFTESGLSGYRKGRDFPAQHHISRLSPHLHFGEVSPNQVWTASGSETENEDRAHFHRELGWREFSYQLLYHFPVLPTRNLQPKFDTFPWENDPSALEAWRKGRTGIPLVDAGMRELWDTGHMHNRLRMVVGSFLVKNMLLDWRHGAAWFWDCLVDADLANNSAGWQWIAGCGADAAPYFRVFNPVTQGHKFDPTGEYTRRHLPELALLPDRYLFSPWEAPARVLQHANVVLGETYPEPVVDIAASRKRALDAFTSLRRLDPEATGRTRYAACGVEV